MKIAIIGPNTPIPPKAWGAVETLIWDMKLSLEELGHDVLIVNIGDPQAIINIVNKYSPDFVHINYDDWVFLYPYIQYPCAVTTHFAYIERPRYDEWVQSDLQCFWYYQTKCVLSVPEHQTSL